MKTNTLRVLSGVAVSFILVLAVVLMGSLFYSQYLSSQYSSDVSYQPPEFINSVFMFIPAALIVTATVFCITIIIWLNSVHQDLRLIKQELLKEKVHEDK